jgi:hypothetical protein
VKGQFNNLWINLNMLVIGGRMSGIMRSQIAIGQGDEVWMGTDVWKSLFSERPPWRSRPPRNRTGPTRTLFEGENPANQKAGIPA